MSEIVCGRCNTPSRTLRHGEPWCEPCGTYLVLHAETGQWVSFAEREHRQRAAENERAIAESARLVDAHLFEAQRLLPEGWTARRHQAIRGATYSIAVDAPDGIIDATSYLSPPDERFGWYVSVHNRVTGVGFPLFADGGARAASFDTVRAAVAAGVQALRGEIFDETQRLRLRDGRGNR